MSGPDVPTPVAIAAARLWAEIERADDDSLQAIASHLSFTYGYTTTSDALRERLEADRAFLAAGRAKGALRDRGAL